MDKERQAPLHPMQQDVIDELNKLENSLLAGMNQMSLKGGDPERLGNAREHIEAAFANMRYIAAGRRVDKPAEYPPFQRPKERELAGNLESEAPEYSGKKKKKLILGSGVGAKEA